MWRSEWEGGVQLGKPFQPSMHSSHPAIHASPLCFRFTSSTRHGRRNWPLSALPLQHVSGGRRIEAAGRRKLLFLTWYIELCLFSLLSHGRAVAQTCGGMQRLPAPDAYPDMQSLASSASLCTHDHAPGLMLIMVSWLSVTCHQTGLPRAPEGGFLLPSDCQQALPWTSDQLLHLPVGCNRTFSSEIWNPTQEGRSSSKCTLLCTLHPPCQTRPSLRLPFRVLFTFYNCSEDCLQCSRRRFSPWVGKIP